MPYVQPAAVPMLLTEILVTAYAFVVGSCVGSFLNVVAWRLPLGMSLIKPASHCPQCKTPIRLRDNVPVLGWILLRGRCRSCGCWISPRYPLVEFAVGVAFALLAWRDLATAGSNLARGRDWAPFAAGLTFDAVHLGVWLYHVTLVSILATIVLIEFDGRRLPRGLFIFAFCAGLFPPLVWLALRVALQKSLEFGVGSDVRAMFVAGVYGVGIAWSFDPRRSERGRLIPLATALSAVGLFLGDAAVPAATFAAAVMLMLDRIRLNTEPEAAKRFAGSAFVCVATIAIMVAWPSLQGVGSTDQMESRVWLTCGAIAICLVMTLMAPRDRLAASDEAPVESRYRNM